MTGINNRLIVLILFFFVGCASAPPEPKQPEKLTDVLSMMESSYWSCSNFFTAADVSLLLGTQPTRCKNTETNRNTIGVIIKRDQAEPLINCVLPGSPAESGRLQIGATIWAVASDGVSTPEGAHKALQKHMKEGKKLVISTNRGSVSVVPKRAEVRKCSWEVPGDVSSRMVEYSLQNEDTNIASVTSPTKPGSSQVVGTFLNGWMVDIVWDYRE